MIFGHISELGQVPFPAAIMKAFAYLRETDFTDLDAGRYDIEGDQIFAMIFDLETKPKSANFPEVHRRYIDVQYLVSGREIIGVSTDLGGLEIEKPYFEAHDILFYRESHNETDLKMLPGNFAVLFPQDIHRPNCQYASPEKIRKVVVKIAMSQLV